MEHRGLKLLLLVAALGAALPNLHCGGTELANGHKDGGPGSDGSPVPPGPPPTGLPAPTNHRPAAMSCPTTRPPGVNMEGGAPFDAGPYGFCTDDSQCTAGTNGRCTPSGHNAGPSCQYDTCFADSDCAKGQICECGGPAGIGRYANTCLSGNCRVDSDCGAGGYCSPSYGTSCGAYGGIAGYFCHTAQDTCTDDSQCTAQPNGYCGYQPMTGSWSCIYSFCAG